uniref:protein-serine/threonine phosphatase n=1 Tax=Kalanchoe fedtschenkoi TaxID=63787 RepID=A0A7N0T1X6_KALFE
MLESLMNLLSLCFRPFSNDSAGGSGSNGAVADAVGRDGLLWFRDFGRCAAGEFSMAVIQANQVLEDQSQIESGPFGTFVGVYDGHGGPDAARFVCDHLFPRFQAISAQYGGIVTAEIIRRAFLQTEEEFIAHVGELWNVQPSMATVGTCCLVGVVYQQTLFVANLGDSRAVLGKKVGSTGGVAAIQLSTEHNANIDEIRHELKDLHPDDPEIVVLKHGVWRVKGIIQVSKSIGDAYMKHEEYNREPISAKFRLPQPMHMPYMSANPTILTHQIHPNDSFVIFASDGLWEHLSNEQAVEIVHDHPPAGSAKRLIKAALQEAARKREMRYSDLRRIDKKVRRHFHDDITVIILFFNRDLISRGSRLDYSVSVRSALEH